VRRAVSQNHEGSNTDTRCPDYDRLGWPRIGSGPQFCVMDRTVPDKGIRAELGEVQTEKDGRIPCAAGLPSTAKLLPDNQRRRSVPGSGHLLSARKPTLPSRSEVWAGLGLGRVDTRRYSRMAFQTHLA
jgi:hypothetical protein